MGNIFAGSEVVELGVQIEKNGFDFYNELATKLKDKKVKDTFKFLAGEEEKHIAAFQNILESVQRYEPQESYQGEYVAYMRALASEHIFTKKDKGKEIAKKISTAEDAIEMGIGFEKDSIVFYEGMKKAVPEEDHKVLDTLLLQEQSHLTQLVDLKKAL